MQPLEHTWIGYPVTNDIAKDVANDVTNDVPVDDDDTTAVERFGADPSSGERVFYRDRDEHAVLSRDMVEELRRRLREAEAREESGVRERPTPPSGLTRDPVELDGALDPSVAPLVEDAPRSEAIAALETAAPESGSATAELDDLMSVLPELEVALAPNSESNFYAGFDEQHPDGVFLATYETRSPGTPVYVVVHLPAGYHFCTPAVVEWVREAPAGDAASSERDLPPGVGLKMCGLDRRMRQLIRTYARHRKPIFWIG